MKKLSVALVALGLLVSGCADFDSGHEVRGWVRKDPGGPCRLLLGIVVKGDYRIMAVRIENCTAPKLGAQP